MSSHHMLSRAWGVGGSGGRWEAERKATCTLCILGRPVPVIHHKEETGRCLVCLYVSGVVVMGDYGGVKGCNMSQHLSGTCLKAPHFKPLKVFGAIHAHYGSRSADTGGTFQCPKVLELDWTCPSGPWDASFRPRQILQREYGWYINHPTVSYHALIPVDCLGISVKLWMTNMLWGHLLYRITDYFILHKSPKYVTY